MVQTVLLILFSFFAAVGLMDVLLFLLIALLKDRTVTRPVLTVCVDSAGERWESQTILARLLSRLFGSVLCRTVLVVDCGDGKNAEQCRGYCAEHGELLYCRQSQLSISAGNGGVDPSCLSEE